MTEHQLIERECGCGQRTKAAGRLGGFLEHAREQIAASDLAGFGETGFRVQGRLHRVHCARTGRYTVLAVHPKRGAEGMKAMGVLPSFAGSLSMTPGHRTTPIRVLITSFAVREAISQGRDAVDQAALAARIRLYRSAVLAGASQTALRGAETLLTAEWRGAEKVDEAIAARTGKIVVTQAPAARTGWL